MDTSKNAQIFSFFALIISPLCALIPFQYIGSPLMVLAFCGSTINGATAKSTFKTVVISYLLSSLLLHLVYGYELYGDWLIFTLSGYAMMVCLGKMLKNTDTRFRISFAFGTFLLANILYWLWTNFGVWLMGDFYPHTLDGLSLCFIAALPFLKSSILSNCLWLSLPLLFLNSLNSMSSQGKMYV